MRTTITTNDKVEAYQLIKSGDMSLFITELVNNGWRRFKHTNYDYQKSWDVINELLDKYDINIEEL